MDLSILIPARNEMFLARTIENILENIEGNTEVIVVLDGAWADPPIPDDERVTLVYHSESIGQRAATNEAAKLSKAKYVMKVDAHCAFDKGFDVKMMKEMHDDWTMVPMMRNLHAFDWVCKKCGERRYQGPSGPCEKCGGETKRDILWRAKPSPQSSSYRFDKTMHFQYWGAFKRRPEGQGDVCDTMSIQGSCFIITRKKYFELDICDENFGSWGQQGVEVACKTWLSGGRVRVNKKTWYAHMFRTQGKDFGFPYPLSGRAIGRAREYSRELFQRDGWPKAKHKFQWLLDKFYPIPDWHDDRHKKSKKGIIFYTDNQLKLKIAHAVQKNLRGMGLPIISASLKPMKFGDKNIHLPLERSSLTMFKQQLAALEASKSEIIFFCEHDVLYHYSHFDFTPPKKDVYYYNTNVWKLRLEDGHALRTAEMKQTSGLCAYRDLLLKHYRKRVEMVEKTKFTRRMGYEPGTHNREERVDDYKSDIWESKYSNVDIRHDHNLTASRWEKGKFRNKKFTKGWIEKKPNEKIPGWGKGKDIIIL